MSKIIVKDLEGPASTSNKIYIASGSQLDIAGSPDGASAINLAVNGSDITSGTITAARLPSMDITTSTGDVTITGALPSTITFAGAKAPTVYYKDQSTTESSYAGGTTWVATGHGFYHAFTSGKTYIVAFDLNTYNLANGYEGNCWGLQVLYTDTNSTSIPAAASTTLPGTSQTITQANLGSNGQGATNGGWAVGNFATHMTLPFSGTGTTDVFYVAVRTYNTNVTVVTKGIKWYVYEFDTAPTTTSG